MLRDGINYVNYFHSLAAFFVGASCTYDAVDTITDFMEYSADCHTKKTVRNDDKYKRLAMTLFKGLRLLCIDSAGGNLYVI